MSERRVNVFSSDLTLAPYLAHYLQVRSCNILEEGGRYYLHSFYFEKVPLLSTYEKRAHYSSGLGAVLDLISPSFDSLSISMKREECIRAVLCILNGIIRLKYKNCGSLLRSRSVSTERVEHGTDYEIDISGKRVYTAIRDVAVRAVIGTSQTFFQNADKKQPSTKKLWNIARKDGAVARALFHYSRSEDLVELRKVVEEVMVDTYIRPATKTGKIRFDDWNKQHWTMPEIGTSKMDEFWALLHNPLILGDQALHCMPLASISQANQFKTSGTSMSIQEAKDIVQDLLLKWGTSKR